VQGFETIVCDSILHIGLFKGLHQMCFLAFPAQIRHRFVESFVVADRISPMRGLRFITGR